MFNLRSVALPLFAVLSVAEGQSVWNGSAMDGLWDVDANWTPAVSPGSSSNVIFNTVTTITGVINDFTIASITFQPGVGEDTITTVGPGTLTVNGPITNNTSLVQKFDLVLDAGANATWSGPLNFANIVNVNTNQLTLTGAQSFTGSNLNFTIGNS